MIAPTATTAPTDAPMVEIPLYNNHRALHHRRHSTSPISNFQRWKLQHFQRCHPLQTLLYTFWILLLDYTVTRHKTQSHSKPPSCLPSWSHIMPSHHCLTQASPSRRLHRYRPCRLTSHPYRASYTSRAEPSTIVITFQRWHIGPADLQPQHDDPSNITFALVWQRCVDIYRIPVY